MGKKSQWEISIPMNKTMKYRWKCEIGTDQHMNQILRFFKDQTKMKLRGHRIKQESRVSSMKKKLKAGEWKHMTIMSVKLMSSIYYIGVINGCNLLHWSDALYWSATIQEAEFCKFDILKHPN